MLSILADFAPPWWYFVMYSPITWVVGGFLTLAAVLYGRRWIKRRRPNHTNGEVKP